MKYDKSAGAALAAFLGWKQPSLLRSLRETALRSSVKRVFDVIGDGMVFSWQPLWLIVLKLALLAGAALGAFNLHPQAARVLQKAIDFLKLAVVFALPQTGESLAQLIARWGMASLVAILALPPAGRILAAAFLGAATAPGTGRLFIVRDFLIWRSAEEIRVDMVTSVELTQHALYRALGIGTICLLLRDNRQHRLLSFWSAQAFMQALFRIG